MREATTCYQRAIIESSVTYVRLRFRVKEDPTYNILENTWNYRRRIEPLAEERLGLEGITSPSFTGDKSVGILSPPSP